MVTVLLEYFTDCFIRVSRFSILFNVCFFCGGGCPPPLFESAPLPMTKQCNQAVVKMFLPVKR